MMMMRVPSNSSSPTVMFFAILKMVQESCFELMNAIIHNGKYRYVVAAVLILNLLFLNTFFIDNRLLTTNPFKLSKLSNEQPEPWVLTEFHPSTEKSESLTSNSNTTKIIKSKSKPYISTDITKFPELGPPSTKSHLSIHDYDFHGPYVGWPLERVCNETKRTPGVIFLCDNNSGGIGNIRNFILTCIRYAIEAGASGLVLPKIQRRSDKELSNIFTTGFQPFHYFFDDRHFKNSMSTYCPNIIIYDEVEDIPNVENLQMIKDFYPKSLNIDFDGCDERGVNRHLDMFRLKFDEWLVKSNLTISTKNPVSIRFKWATFFEWPIYRDGPEFATTFGDLLRIRSDIQQLAAATIKELSIAMGLKPKPSAIEASYIGVHLRTENDALSFWPRYDEQSDGYLNQTKLRNFTHIYLASGNATESRRFAARAWDLLRVNVTTKNDLLQGNELTALHALSWDQQALVDFLVLQKSTFFTGCSFSSFAMNIAIKRHTMTGGIHTRQWKNPGDQFSRLIGHFESWYGDWMFMYECLWP